MLDPLDCQHRWESGFCVYCGTTEPSAAEVADNFAEAMIENLRKNIASSKKRRNSN
jgi:hypothetical protein